MNTWEVHERIEEYRRIKKDAGPDETALAEAALFIEDVFSIDLTDQDIVSEKLGSLDLMERFVLEKMGLK